MVELRASQSIIWVNCSGSTQLSQREDSDDIQAREGTLCHLLAQLVVEGLLSDTNVEAVNTNAEFITRNDTGLVATADHIDLAIEAVNFCKALHGAGPTGAGIGVCEQSFDDTVLPKGVSGTSDFITYHQGSKTLHVVDFKFGYTPVSAHGNTQLLIYSLGAMSKYDKAAHPIESIALHIYQPRNYVTGPISTWTLKPSEWNDHISKLHEAAATARTGPWNTRTGPWCTWCKSRLYCAAFITTVSTICETVDTAPVDSDLSPAQCGVLLAWLQQSEEFIKSANRALSDYIISEIDAGRPVEGWMVDAGKGRRAWSGSVAEIKAAGKMFGVELTAEKPITITEAWRNTALRSILEKLISHKSGSKKLVPYDSTDIERRFKK